MLPYYPVIISIMLHETNSLKKNLVEASARLECLPIYHQELKDISYSTSTP